MNTQDTTARDAAVQRVRAVIESLDREGATPIDAGDAKADFRTALPQFLKEGRQFDLAFVDGNHRFDAVFLDLYYLGHLVRKGGVIILDDYNLPGIERAASFFVKNLEWKIEERSLPGDAHRWVVLRTSEDEDTRDFRYFVEF